MTYDGYECLRVQVDRGIAFVTIDHPPINLFDLALIREMDQVGRELESDPAVRVVVFQSANPEFFIAHADVALIRTLPTTPPPKPTRLGPFHQMVDRLQIAEIKAVFGSRRHNARTRTFADPYVRRTALRTSTPCYPPSTGSPPPAWSATSVPCRPMRPSTSSPSPSSTWPAITSCGTSDV